VTKAVPCSFLPPLVRQGRLPGADGASVLVYDNALFKSGAAAGAQPVAFDGVPAPKEAEEDARMFYYYYDDDADDTQVCSESPIEQLPSLHTMPHQLLQI
jgi:hypothetical protein